MYVFKIWGSKTISLRAKIHFLIMSEIRNDRKRFQNSLLLEQIFLQEVATMQKLTIRDKILNQNL